MANTYTQIHIHGIFSVQNRFCVIDNSWKDELYKYITGIIKNNQETHHKKKSFIEEYKEFMKAFNIDFDERYIFKSIEF
ncbi:MAG: hypothetical protein AABZ13_02185 [Planctomycetota bacterium]